MRLKLRPVYFVFILKYCEFFQLAASTVDLFIVYPNMTISEGSTQDNKLTRLKGMTAPDNSITYNFATDVRLFPRHVRYITSFRKWITTCVTELSRNCAKTKINSVLCAAWPNSNWKAFDENLQLEINVLHSSLLHFAMEKLRCSRKTTSSNSPD